MSNDPFDHNERFQRGLALRQDVLGEDHVARSLERASDTPFLAEIQQLTTEFGWGEVWAREGLPRKTRSFLAMAFLAANGKHDEFKTHVRGALNNGATEAEIAEVLIQAAVYCGFPVALESFRLAGEVLEEVDRTRSTSAE